MEQHLQHYHAIQGSARHLAARWCSHFNDNEQGVGSVRRRLEFLERGGKSGKVSVAAKWAPKAKLIATYNAKALTLLKGSGFVEAYHLLTASVELSLAGNGIGALPEGRGNLLTALSLNNLGVYHRRRGQGRQALRLLLRAEEIEGSHVAVSTQCNLIVVFSDLGGLAHALERAHKLMRRVQQQLAEEGQSLPPERAAVLAVLMHNLGVDLHNLDLEQRGLRPPSRHAARHSAQAFHLGTEHHPDLDILVTHDGAGAGSHWLHREHHSCFHAAQSGAWCFKQASKIITNFLGPSHPVSAALFSAGTASIDVASPYETNRREGGRISSSMLTSPKAKLSIDDGGSSNPQHGGMTDGIVSHSTWPPAGKLSIDDGGAELSRGGRRLSKLGHTLLGQRVDGSTVGVGWPQFTLIEL